MMRLYIKLCVLHTLQTRERILGLNNHYETHLNTLTPPASRFICSLTCRMRPLQVLSGAPCWFVGIKLGKCEALACMFVFSQTTLAKRDRKRKSSL